MGLLRVRNYWFGTNKMCDAASPEQEGYLGSRNPEWLDRKNNLQQVSVKIRLTGDIRTMKFGVIVFPGSNCDHDSFYAVNHAAGQPATFLWHDSSDLQNCDAIIVPGGFAHGDYLRTGALARFATIMEPLKKFAAGGGLVIGICNGFQILC